MKELLSLLLLGSLLFTAPLISADKDIKEFNFNTKDITGNAKKPVGSNVNVISDVDKVTKVKPREDFLSHLSNSIDDL